jgi:hypothetical protein
MGIKAKHTHERMFLRKQRKLKRYKRRDERDRERGRPWGMQFLAL